MTHLFSNPFRSHRARQRMFASAIAGLGLAGGFGQTAAADESLRVQALWTDGDGRTIQTGFLSRLEFDARAEALLADGLRLIDVETAIVNGSRGFSGLWVEGTGSNTFFAGIELEALTNQMTEMQANGLQLVDFEVFRSGGDTRYIGVFRPGQERQMMVRPLPIAQFLERKDLMRTLGLRLRDVEPIAIGGRWRFAALYGSDAPPAVFTGFRPRQRFIELRDRMASNGWELFDFERVPNAEGDDVYIGLWRQGDGPSDVSRLRTPAQHLFLTGQQRQDGKVPIDAELKVVASGGTPPPVPDPEPEDVPNLPRNPPGITIAGSNSQRMVIDFNSFPDGPRIEVPFGWLPKWLPQQDGEALFPDAFCGFNIRLADRVYWQVGGDDDYEDDVFKSREITTSNDELGGIAFSGPIGSCAGSERDWIFRPPFTAQEQVVSPLPGMRLVIEGVGAELRFQGYDAPVEATFKAFDLFKPPTRSKLEEIREAFAALADEGDAVANYCAAVGAYWTAVCTLSGSSCPPLHPALPECSLP